MLGLGDVYYFFSLCLMIMCIIKVDVMFFVGFWVDEEIGRDLVNRGKCL